MTKNRSLLPHLIEHPLWTSNQFILISVVLLPVAINAFAQELFEVCGARLSVIEHVTLVDLSLLDGAMSNLMSLDSRSNELLRTN